MSIDADTFASFQKMATKLNSSLLDAEQFREAFKSLLDLQALSPEILSVSMQSAQVLTQSVKTAVLNLAPNEKVAQTLSAIAEFYSSYSLSSNTASIDTITVPSQDNRSGFSESSNDYITADETPIKECDLLETLAIPIGNNRVRIKTSDFIAFLTLIFTTLFTLCNFAYERHDAVSANHSTEQFIEVEREKNVINNQQNQILYEFLNSIDTSESSNSDAIDRLILSIEDVSKQLEAVNEKLQALESIHQEHGSVPDEDDSALDPLPQKTDNSPE